MSGEGTESRSRHPGLFADCYAKDHIFVADGEGAQVILDLFHACGADIRGRVIIVYAETALGSYAYATELSRLPIQVVHCFPTVLAAVERLVGILGAAKLGTRVYAAGSERLIGFVTQLAQASGMDPGSVLTERRDALPRCVHCAECYGLTDDVTTCVVQCAHCGVTLFVRSDASERLAVLMGYAADTENSIEMNQTPQSTDGAALL